MTFFHKIINNKFDMQLIIFRKSDIFSIMMEGDIICKAY